MKTKANKVRTFLLFAIDKEIQNSKDSSLPSLKHKENSICICFEYSTM